MLNGTAYLKRQNPQQFCTNCTESHDYWTNKCPTCEAVALDAVKGQCEKIQNFFKIFIIFFQNFHNFFFKIFIKFPDFHKMLTTFSGYFLQLYVEDRNVKHTVANIWQGDTADVVLMLNLENKD